MDYQLTQTGSEVQEILDKGAESYSKAEIDAQVDELQDGIDSSVKNKGSESNIVVGVGNSSNIGITSSSIGMETGNSAILIGNDAVQLYHLALFFIFYQGNNSKIFLTIIRNNI